MIQEFCIDSNQIWTIIGDFNNKFNSKFSYIKVWFTDLNYQPLQVEDRINYINYNRLLLY